MQKGVFDIKFEDTDHQWADIFTKALPEEHLIFIRSHLVMVDLSDE